jgi:hypothetical protein
MRHDDDALLRVALLEHLGHAADPQRHVGPALAVGRPVVELAQPLAAGRLLGKLRADALAGETVEGAEVALAQALVADQLEVEPRLADGDLRGRGGPGVRRAERRVRLLAGVPAGEPLAECG